MSEENQSPQPQWVTELKEWGIDVEAFDAKWEQAGADAKAQFQQALMNAKAEYETEKSEFQERLGEVREDVEALFQKMNTAWDEMIASIQQQLNSDAPGDDNTNKQA